MKKSISITKQVKNPLKKAEVLQRLQSAELQRKMQCIIHVNCTYVNDFSKMTTMFNKWKC